MNDEASFLGTVHPVHARRNERKNDNDENEFYVNRMKRVAYTVPHVL